MTQCKYDKFGRPEMSIVFPAGAVSSAFFEANIRLVLYLRESKGLYLAKTLILLIYGIRG